MEHVILSRISYNQLQSPLQYGFTKGLSPTMTILAVTEAISDTVDRHTPLYIAALDVKRAFDVVHHPSLLHKLFHQSNICNSTWNYLKNNNLNTDAWVKLQGISATYSLSTRVLAKERSYQHLTMNYTSMTTYVNYPDQISAPMLEQIILVRQHVQMT